MDPNKRGNPPFEPSSYAAGLERRLARMATWSKHARNYALWLLDGPQDERELAEQWWREQLNQPTFVLSTPPSQGTAQ